LREQYNLIGSKDPLYFLIARILKRSVYIHYTSRSNLAADAIRTKTSVTFASVSEAAQSCVKSNEALSKAVLQRLLMKFSISPTRPKLHLVPLTLRFPQSEQITMKKKTLEEAFAVERLNHKLLDLLDGDLTRAERRDIQRSRRRIQSYVDEAQNITISASDAEFKVYADEMKKTQKALDDAIANIKQVSKAIAQVAAFINLLGKVAAGKAGSICIFSASLGTSW
jgi:hypothetical protein